MTRVALDTDLPPRRGSELAFGRVMLPAGATLDLTDSEHDSLLFVAAGDGTLDGEALSAATAAHVPAGEAATLGAGATGLEAVRVTVGADTDLHAPMGARERVVASEHVEPGKATGSRSFQVLFGPHNGSTRATMFIGYIPPGKAPWHYHLYDEIVWVWKGAGRFHLEQAGTVEDLTEGAAFRLSPREVHIVENLSADTELAVLGIFTPAGSPSAAYLMPDVAAAYAIG
jgi:quercetin dioxygenase-like cupin family protein